jgi:hypothetical protein
MEIFIIAIIAIKPWVWSFKQISFLIVLCEDFFVFETFTWIRYTFWLIFVSNFFVKLLLKEKKNKVYERKFFTFYRKKKINYLTVKSIFNTYLWIPYKCCCYHDDNTTVDNYKTIRYMKVFACRFSLRLGLIWTDDIRMEKYFI